MTFYKTHSHGFEMWRNGQQFGFCAMPLTDWIGRALAAFEKRTLKRRGFIFTNDCAWSR